MIVAESPGRHGPRWYDLPAVVALESAGRLLLILTVWLAALVGAPLWILAILLVDWLDRVVFTLFGGHQTVSLGEGEGHREP